MFYRFFKNIVKKGQRPTLRNIYRKYNTFIADKHEILYRQKEYFERILETDNETIEE